MTTDPPEAKILPTPDDEDELALGSVQLRIELPALLQRRLRLHALREGRSPGAILADAIAEALGRTRR